MKNHTGERGHREASAGKIPAGISKVNNFEPKIQVTNLRIGL